MKCKNCEVELWRYNKSGYCKNCFGITLSKENDKKTCSLCRKELSVSEFNIKEYRKTDGKPRYQTVCKKCNREYQKKHYKKNKEKYIERAKKDRVILREWWNEYKSALSCSTCGESHPSCIEFHHKNPIEKEFGLGEFMRKTLLKERILKEVEKCDVLCSNCHKKLHYEEKRSHSLIG